MIAHHVRISRQWHNPTITIDITKDEIAIAMPLVDFVRSIASEVGNPLALVTQAQLERKLLEAATSVTESMKHETTAVI